MPMTLQERFLSGNWAERIGMAVGAGLLAIIVAGTAADLAWRALGRGALF